MSRNKTTQQHVKLFEPHEEARSDASEEISIATLRFDHLTDGLGIGTAHPRLSWIIATSRAGWYQTAYELQAYDPWGAFVSSTGRIESDQSVLVSWPFPPLASHESLHLRVRVWGTDGSISSWSDFATVEAGLLHEEDWTARFVTPTWDEDTSQPGPSPLLRHEFTIGPDVVRARLYITALGVYEPYINGQLVGDHVLAPGWTSYRHRLRYQTFDVTSLLREGRNVLGAMLGDGWYRGRLGFVGGRRNIYGERLALLAQLEITYDDGTRERIVTDESWRATRGPILASDLYDGESYDARLESPAWSTPNFDDSDWTGTHQVDWDFKTLVAPSGPPVRRVELVEPVAITTSPSGHTIVDFGQNLVGRVRFTVHGDPGQTITLRHAEVLEDGELCTRPLRQAKATDRYILRGDEVETWEPRFTFHGFRYVEVDGWPGDLQQNDLCAVVCHSDLERTGWFDCSDPLINRLHENVVWSMRGNFLDVPTDCPQRDERLGWTGDIQMFAPAATFLYDVAGFLTSWLADLAAEQTENGLVPFVVPDVMVLPNPPAAAWGDAAVIVPWVLYQRFGDTGILATQFESMCAWVDLVTRIAGPEYLWNTGYQLGDWLDPSAPPDKPDDVQTDKYLVATAYYARSTELLGQIAEIVGAQEKASHYRKLAAEIREAFHGEYITTRGRVTSDSATAYALALQFGLLREEEQRRHAGTRLAEIVRQGGYHIDTGFVGTPLICDALCAVGEEEAAFRLLTQTECPSWLYPVTMGATTTWERWDSLLPDGSVNPGEMTSFNHYAFGAVVDWLHRTVAGLAPAAPGYRRIEIRPTPGGGLTSAQARHRTPYGMAAVAWSLEAGTMDVEVVVPPNTTARVVLPDAEGEFTEEPIEVGPGRHHWRYRSRSAETPRPALSLASRLQDLMAAPAASRTVIDILARHLPDLASRMAEEAPLRWNLDTPISALCTLAADPDALRADLSDALERLVS